MLWLYKVDSTDNYYISMTLWDSTDNYYISMTL